MCLPAGPHLTRRGGRQKGPGVKVDGCRLEDRYEVGVRGEVGVGEVVILGPEHGEIWPGGAEVVEHVLASCLVMGQGCRRPQVDLTEVAEEFANVPARAVGHHRIESGIERRLGESSSFPGDGCDVGRGVHVFLRSCTQKPTIRCRVQ